MKYWGGKHRAGPKIAEAMLQHISKLCEHYPVLKETKMDYIEPMCGFLGVTRCILPLAKTSPLPFGDFVAMDANRYVIEFWQALQKGWTPNENITQTDFHAFKDTKTEYTPQHIFVGHCCGFQGKYFKSNTCNLEKEIPRGIKTIEQLRPLLDKITFLSSDFFDIKFWPQGCLIYCDPPYVSTSANSRQTNGYDDLKLFQTFDNDSFWAKVRRLSTTNIVFISESKAPKDFAIIFTRKTSGKYKRSEHLFVHQTWTIPRKKVIEKIQLSRRSVEKG
jgi:site-specific DNA-adenine methylase